MQFFQQKQIHSKNQLGSKLKQLREEKGWTIQQLANQTGLEKDYIIAIETSAFHNLPQGDVYKKLFIKRYLSAFSQIDTQQYLDQIQHQFSNYDKKNKDANSSSTQYFKNTPTLIRIAVVGLFILSLSGYFGLQIKKIIEPPKLTLQSPQKSQTLHKEKITIKGKTTPGARVTINGKPVSYNKNGNFDKVLPLKQGLNTLTIKARTEHSKTKTIVRQVVYEQETKFSMEQTKNSKS